MRPETPSSIRAASLAGSVRLTLDQLGRAGARCPPWWRAKAGSAVKQRATIAASAETARKRPLPAAAPDVARCPAHIKQPLKGLRPPKSIGPKHRLIRKSQSQIDVILRAFTNG